MSTAREDKKKARRRDEGGVYILREGKRGRVRGRRPRQFIMNYSYLERNKRGTLLKR